MEKRTRGRPREYDRTTALESAMQVFSTKGFTAASLDDLAAATGMNRPSLYNAFGDKESLYRETLDHFIAGLRARIGTILVDEPDLERGAHPVLRRRARGILRVPARSRLLRILHRTGRGHHPP